MQLPETQAHPSLGVFSPAVPSLPGVPHLCSPLPLPPARQLLPSPVEWPLCPRPHGAACGNVEIIIFPLVLGMTSPSASPASQLESSRAATPSCPTPSRAGGPWKPRRPGPSISPRGGRRAWGGPAARLWPDSPGCLPRPPQAPGPRALVSSLRPTGAALQGACEGPVRKEEMLGKGLRS